MMANELPDGVLRKMRQDLKKAKPTVINVSSKEKVNMKLAVSCELLWCIKVEGGYDVNLTTSWKRDEDKRASSKLTKSYGKVLSKTDRVTIPGPGTYSLLLDNSYSWLNSKVVKLTYVTATVRDGGGAAVEEDGTVTDGAPSSAAPTKSSDAAAPIPPPRLVGKGAFKKSSGGTNADVESMTVNAVGKWLSSIGLGESVDIFAKEKIDGSCLIRLGAFPPKDQAEYMQSHFKMGIHESLRFGLELEKSM
eukprot:g385.t1